jgi:hypothetical protein
MDVKKNCHQEDCSVFSRLALQVFFLFYLAGGFIWVSLSEFPWKISYLRTHQWEALAGMVGCSASGYLGYLILKSKIKR